MAISHNVPGLKAEVLVDGEPLTEYDDDDDDDSAEPNTITKYVEAKSDKELVLNYAFDMDVPSDQGVEVRIEVDEKKCRVGIPQKHLRKSHCKYGPGFFKNGEYFRQHYRFTALDIVEEVDGITNPSDIRKDMESKGSILLEFRFITNVRESTREHHKGPAQILQTISSIPERALKGDARSHQATLSNPRPSRSGTQWKYDRLDREPFAKIRFKYRSRAALKALRVISDNEDEIVERPDEVQEDQMTAEQLREAFRRAKRREDEGRRVKQESAARNIKRERAQTMDRGDDEDEVTIVESRTRKRPRAEPEVIVLD